MMKKIKYYRQILDELKSKTKKECRFSSLMYTHLEEGRLHLGNMLKYINAEPSEYRKASLKRLEGRSDYIPLPLDRNEDFRMPEFNTKVELVDYVRELILGITEELEELSFENKMVTIYLNEAIVSLTLARNYGGMILGEIAKTRNEK